ncbi:hypothetical protein K3495_g5868 [Podosphaera aphanis]|nr:hypothetical protein K3495_g5868 [Podosphaera aphanis]
MAGAGTTTTSVLTAIRLIPGPSKFAASNILLLKCRVKAGVSEKRHGILFVSDSHIEVGVSARPRDNEANQALSKVLSEALDCPKSSVKLVRGQKSGEKSIAIEGIQVKGNQNEFMTQIKDKLKNAMRR